MQHQDIIKAHVEERQKATSFHLGTLPILAMSSRPGATGVCAAVGISVGDRIAFGGNLLQFNQSKLWLASASYTAP